MSGVVVPYTRRRGGRYYLNLRIPADVRMHFPTANGGHRTHIVEALGTCDALAARRIALERHARWARHFADLRRDGAAGPEPHAALGQRIGRVR